MRKGIVYYSDAKAGIISETESGFLFEYDANYLKQEGSQPVSLTLPLQETPYRSNTLFSFFDGLIPEGWLLNIAERNWKINRRDRMGLLQACCKDCIGNISVEPFNEEESR